MSKGKVEIPISRVPGLGRVEKELVEVKRTIQGWVARIEKALYDREWELAMGNAEAALNEIEEVADRLGQLERLLRDQDRAVVKMYKAMADIVGATADRQRRLLQVVAAVCELVGPRKVAELLDLRGRGYYTDIPADFLQDIADFIDGEPEESEMDIY